MKTLIYAAILLIALFLKILPKPFFPIVAGVMVVLFRIFARKEVRQLKLNVDRVLGLPADNEFGQTFLKQVLWHQNICALETVREIFSDGSVVVDGLKDYCDQLKKYKAQGLGVIVISGHQGSWELMAKYSGHGMGEPLAVLAKPSRYRAVSDALEKFRAKMEARVLWSNSKRILREMLGTLHQNKALGFVMDQKPEGRIGLRLDFLGFPAEFVSGPAAIAVKTRAPVIAGFCMREGPWQYRLRAVEIVPPNHNIQDEDFLTKKMVAAIEENIRLYPEQWTWSYKRWKFDPS